MQYFSHPLNKYSAHVEQLPLNKDDQTPENFKESFFPPFKQTIKDWIGSLVYPLKNKFEYKKALRLLDPSDDNFNEILPKPDTVTLGHRGSGNEIFYRIIKNKLQAPDVVLHFGCGLGYELILTARYLKPRLIIGCEYFNYSKAWSFVSSYIKGQYGCEVQFYQVDMRNPIPSDIPRADLLLSFAVLEHLKEMDSSLEKLKGFLKPGGSFASIWGPMWNSYSGDHIAADLGLEHGFDHLLLNDKEYFEFYTNHPRNKENFEKGVKSWLQLGLANFATYKEYMYSLHRIFGSPKYLLWVLSLEAIKFKKCYPDKWQKVLNVNTHLSETDLVLTNASVII